MKWVIVTTSVFFIGCASLGVVTPGDVRTTESKFDGAKEAVMEPAWVDTSGSIKLGLFKNTKMKPAEYIMRVVVSGAHNFERGKNLHVKVDDKVYSFESPDSMTNHQLDSGSAYVAATSWSSKTYVVTESLLNDMLNGKSVVVKVDLTDSYVEGNFHVGGYTTAKKNFPVFLEAVRNGYSTKKNKMNSPQKG